MPTTRAMIEQVLIRRCGRKLAMVDLDAVTVDGTNADLLDPIGSALSLLDIPVANSGSVTDSDLAILTAYQVAAILDVAEVRVLESVLGNWDEPDQVADTNNSQALGKLYDSLEATVKRLRMRIERQYGIGLGSLTTGVIDLDFAETFDPLTGWPR